MKNNKTPVIIFALILILGLITYLYYYNNNSKVANLDYSITYTNTDYGFNFSLPANWKGYSIIKDSWKGTMLKNASTTSGPKILIRNPKWTESAPYEDLPILIFTTSQWNAYLAEDFTISAAPIAASELARNNKYVFALPPRWDFDYSLDYKEAQGIIESKPLQTFNIESSQSKLNINLICEWATSYMRFADAKSLDVFVTDCKEGKHPEVIEKYKEDMNLKDGSMI